MEEAPAAAAAVAAAVIGVFGRVFGRVTPDLSLFSRHCAVDSLFVWRLAASLSLACRMPPV